MAKVYVFCLMSRDCRSLYGPDCRCRIVKRLGGGNYGKFRPGM